MDQGDQVLIFDLSPDLKKAIVYPIVRDDDLAAWWTPGKSILLTTARIWDLPNNYFDLQNIH
jgi:hypothetical protein